MAEQDPIPTARMHWARLVLGRGHPVIIIIVLTLVGAGICWFSLQRISSITQTPTRYEMYVEVSTEGCDDLPLELRGDIGSFGSSFLQLELLDEEGQPLLAGKCRLGSIVLTSNLALRPASSLGGPELIRVEGVDLSAQEEVARPWQEDLQSVGVTVVDGALRVLDRYEATEGMPSFSMHVQEEHLPTDRRIPEIHYAVAFEEGWRPLFLTFGFEVPENVKTYFELAGIQRSLDVPRSLDISVSFTTDEVSLVRGSMSDSGDARSINGFLRFGVENNDAESRRESGNVRFSAVLGIGIALIVEAFVILLAIGIRALAFRLGISGAGRTVDGPGSE